MRRLGVFLAHHRRTVWCLILLLSIPPVCGLTGFNLFEPQYGRWVSDEQSQVLQEVRDTFSNRFSGFPVIVVLECDDFFQPERIAALHQAVEIIDEGFLEFGGKELVFWIGSLPQVTLFGSSPLLPEQVDTLEEAQAVGEVVANHPLVDGQLLSADGRTMLIGLMDSDRQVVETVRERAGKVLGAVGIRLRITGHRPLWRAHSDAFKRDHEKIVLIAAAIVVVLALIIFRGLPAIIVSCSGPAVGVFWTLGWLELLGQANNDLAKIILPVMILMVGFTDGVHLVVHIRQQRLKNADAAASVKSRQIQAAASAIEHVGAACLLTSLTTAIGFGSLLLAESEIIQGFGRACAIGVLIAFVAAVLVIPVMSSSWIGRRIHVGTERDLVQRGMRKLDWLIDFVIRRSRLVALAGVLITGWLATMSLSLEPDDRISDRTPHASEAYQAMQHVDASLGGIRPMRIVVNWGDDVSNETIWQVVSEIEAALESEPDISRPLSIRHALSLAPGVEGPAKLGLASLLPADLSRQFWRPDINQAQVIARVQDLGMAHYRPILDRVEREFAKLTIAHPGVQIELTGEAIVDSQAVQQVVKELFYSLAMAAVIIFVVITISVRSIRFGLLSVIPNIFPLVATGAMRACIDTSLDIASACSFAICLGIAVDDTIHFLMRFRHEREQGHDVETSIRRTFVTVGSALVMTTVVMVAGIGSVMTSELQTHFLFASMACATIGSALLGDLIILPALLTQFAGRDPSSTNSETGATHD
ncbi:MAG: efflux RND transporter permease subunit [Planctomycetales bacterium]